jgi:hypothetical protein
MCCGNAGFAFGSFGAGAAPAVVLALLGFARIECRSAALGTRAAAAGRASQAFDVPTRSHKELFFDTGALAFRMLFCRFMDHFFELIE